MSSLLLCTEYNNPFLKKHESYLKPNTFAISLNEIYYGFDSPTGPDKSVYIMVARWATTCTNLVVRPFKLVVPSFSIELCTVSKLYIQ